MHSTEKVLVNNRFDIKVLALRTWYEWRSKFNKKKVLEQKELANRIENAFVVDDSYRIEIVKIFLTRLQSEPSENAKSEEGQKPSEKSQPIGQY